jgi:hypothetical protein
VAILSIWNSFPLIWNAIDKLVEAEFRNSPHYYYEYKLANLEKKKRMAKDDDKIIRNVCEEKEFLLPESRYRK